jgi:hypothetical protein
LIFPRSRTSASSESAICTMVESRNPPTSPARTMLTSSAGNSLCRLNASDRESPFSTSSRTSISRSRSRALCVCSDRIARHLRIGRPDESIVANCREKMARSFVLTRPLPNVISRLSPLLTGSTAMGVRPCCRTRVSASASLSARIFDDTSRPERDLALTR